MKKIAIIALLVSCGCDQASRPRYQVNDNVLQPVVNDLDRRCSALEKRVLELKEELAAMKAKEVEGK